jgi:6-phosphogluconolactonase
VAETEEVRYADPAGLADGIAERLITRIGEIQATGRSPQVCLTGGRIATAVYARLGTDGVRAAVDWTDVDWWWGDERFVAADSDDRNDTPALQALAPLGIAPHRVHRMPADDGSTSLDDAAAAYATELGVTVFDVCLLGVGPDGHVASLFPGHPSASAGTAVGARAIPVRDSPKPPPDRISLTLEVINASAQVWFCVSGQDKADAVGWARTGSTDVPAGQAHGTERTLWLLDAGAAVATC